MELGEGLWFYTWNDYLNNLMLYEGAFVVFSGLKLIGSWRQSDDVIPWGLPDCKPL
ncbi:hypothetical protein LX92_02678 [Maribacter polysiphoniae]|uniref:Uncharacterized protein n=1 Tax=Maribacter polysiphoniae TaxID=429344 RepID=A0A316DXB4_9FLAO|nr:hypothetical protein LX92_02678 [Maribacter polysiphoniae]